MKHSIGAVSFYNTDGRLVSIMGDERIALLRAFYRGKPTGEYRPGTVNPRVYLAREDVNWATAGKRVTD